MKKSDNYKKVEKLVRKCVKHLKKKEYELNLPSNVIDAAIAALKVSENSRRCYATAYEIQIGMNRWNFYGKTFVEYDSFAKDPIIGDTKVSGPDDHLMLIVAHEVSHFIQFRYAPYVKRFQYNWEKPHGDVFKQIYRYLRRDLVNPIIKEKFEEVSA